MFAVLADQFSGFIELISFGSLQASNAMNIITKGAFFISFVGFNSFQLRQVLNKYLQPVDALKILNYRKFQYLSIDETDAYQSKDYSFLRPTVNLYPIIAFLVHLYSVFYKSLPQGVKQQAFGKL
jgi:hypothetical protein